MRTGLMTSIYVGVLLACNLVEARAADSVEAQLLVYQVKEPGSGAYISRMLVTLDYLRLDQGLEDQAFILLDRKAGVLYSVNPEDRTILEIDPDDSPGDDSSGPILVASPLDLDKAPEVAGVKPRQWRFDANGRRCLTAVVAPDLMRESVKAYGEYLQLLSAQHRRGLPGIPPEMRDDCDLAVNVHSPLAVLEKGLPLRESHEQGRVQELQDFRKAFAVPGDSFRLPEDYRRIRLGEF